MIQPLLLLFFKRTSGRTTQIGKSCINKRFTKDNLRTQAQIDDYFNRYYKQIVGIIFDGSPADCSDSAPSLSSLSDPGSLAGEEAQKKLVAAVTTYMASASIFEAQLGQMFRAAASPALSFEYDFNKPVNQPTTSTLKLVGSKSFGSKICGNKKNTDSSTAVNRFTGTINISGNLYNSAPSGVPGTGAFRDLQAGTELDTAFCTSTLNWVGSFLGNSTVGFTLLLPRPSESFYSQGNPRNTTAGYINCWNCVFHEQRICIKRSHQFCAA